MINGFEQETAPLNDIELCAAETIARSLKANHIGADKAITADYMCKAMAQFPIFRTPNGKPYLNGARIRKIVNHIRLTGMCPNLIASSKGYYVSEDKSEILEYVNGLRERANAINQVACILAKQAYVSM